MPCGRTAKLGNLGTGKEHGRAVRAAGNTGAAADALGSVHGVFCFRLRNHDRITVRNPTGVARRIAACLDDGIKGAAVNDQILDNREGSGSPGLDKDAVAITEGAHMQLADRGTLLAAVGHAVHYHASTYRRYLRGSHDQRLSDQHPF